jgi:hypothetical protein
MMISPYYFGPPVLIDPVYVYDIQCGNFNWNKIYNLDTGGFCKKSRNRSIFVFLCPHFGAYGFCISPPESAQTPLTFFFQMQGYAK